jgi:hypothetical protein
MTKKQLKKLKKDIYKYYFRNGQCIYYDIPEMPVKKGVWSRAVDVQFVNKNGEEKFFPFEIWTYIMAEYIERCEADIHFGDFSKNWYKVENISGFANKPLFIDDIFFLKKEEFITKKDVESCIKYFLKQILGIFFMFHIKEYKPSKE